VLVRVIRRCPPFRDPFHSHRSLRIIQWISMDSRLRVLWTLFAPSICFTGRGMSSCPAPCAAKPRCPPIPARKRYSFALYGRSPCDLFSYCLTVILLLLHSALKLQVVHQEYYKISQGYSPFRPFFTHTPNPTGNCSSTIETCNLLIRLFLRASNDPRGLTFLTLRKSAPIHSRFPTRRHHSNNPASAMSDRNSTACFWMACCWCKNMVGLNPDIYRSCPDCQHHQCHHCDVRTVGGGHGQYGTAAPRDGEGYWLCHLYQHYNLVAISPERCGQCAHPICSSCRIYK
jgi:hypothetical protein